MRHLSLGVVLGLLLFLEQAWADPVVLAGVCPPVQNTPQLTIVYGSVTLDGAGATVGNVVEAINPRDDVVGCFVIEAEGLYGGMFVYG